MQEQSRTTTTTTTTTASVWVVGCTVLVGALALMVAWQRRRRWKHDRQPHWAAVPELDLELREVRDEPLYYYQVPGETQG